MAYTAYKFKPSFVEKRLKSYKSNLMKFKGHDNLVANAVRVIRERLEADPRRYLSYGPYWWGIKKVLVDNGVPLGECDDEEIRLAYSGATDEETRECQDFCVWGGYSRGSPTRLPFVVRPAWAISTG